MLVVFVRTLILYGIVLIVMRIMGKRQIGQLQPFELAIAIMISELAAVPMQNTSIPLINGIIPIATLLISQILISYISLKSVKARGVICGKPRILIENGKIIEENLNNEMYTLNDLLEQLRIKSTPNIADVEFAILETNGQLSVIPKSQKRPINPEDIQISTKYEGLPLDLIVDGKVNYKNLKKSNLDENWLKEEVGKFGFNINKIFFASLDLAATFISNKRMVSRRMKANRIIIYMAILLAVIFGVSLYTTKTLETTSLKLESYITQIEVQSNQNNWPKAEQAVSNMKQEWTHVESTWTMLLDHIEIDNISTTMERMEKYIQTKNKSLALAETATLKQYIRHIPEKESFKLKNIF